MTVTRGEPDARSFGALTTVGRDRLRGKCVENV
jgi:hypothetical protein